MQAKFTEKGKEQDQTLFEKVTDEVATAAMKYALVSFSCRSKVTRTIHGPVSLLLFCKLSDSYLSISFCVFVPSSAYGSFS